MLIIKKRRKKKKKKRRRKEKRRGRENKEKGRKRGEHTTRAGFSRSELVPRRLRVGDVEGDSSSALNARLSWLSRIAIRRKKRWRKMKEKGEWKQSRGGERRGDYLRHPSPPWHHRFRLGIVSRSASEPRWATSSSSGVLLSLCKNN